MLNYGESLQGPQGLGGGGLFEQLAKRMPQKSPMGGAWDAIQPTQPPAQLGGGLGESLPEQAPQAGSLLAGLGGLSGQLGGTMAGSPGTALHMPGWKVGRRPPMTTQYGYSGGGLMGDMMGRLPSNDPAGY